MILNFICLTLALIAIVGGSVTSVICAIKDGKGLLQFTCAISGCLLLGASLYAIHMGIQ